jgi:hypothetical protein
MVYPYWEVLGGSKYGLGVILQTHSHNFDLFHRSITLSASGN